MSGFENEVKEIVSRGDSSALGLYADVSTVTSDYQASHGEVVLGDASGGSITVTLPNVNVSVASVTVKKIDSSNNGVTLATQGTANIDSSGSLSITNQYTSREVVSDGSNYFIK